MKILFLTTMLLVVTITLGGQYHQFPDSKDQPPRPIPVLSLKKGGQYHQFPDSKDQPPRPIPVLSLEKADEETREGRQGKKNKPKKPRPSNPNPVQPNNNCDDPDNKCCARQGMCRTTCTNKEKDVGSCKPKSSCKCCKNLEATEVPCVAGLGICQPTCCENQIDIGSCRSENGRCCKNKEDPGYVTLDGLSTLRFDFITEGLARCNQLLDEARDDFLGHLPQCIQLTRDREYTLQIQCKKLKKEGSCDESVSPDYCKEPCKSCGLCMSCEELIRQGLVCDVTKQCSATDQDVRCGQCDLCGGP